MIDDEAMETERKKAMYITQFDLSPKTHSILEKMGISTLRQLTEMERTTAIKYRNVGVKTLEEIDRLLNHIGLSWKKGETSKRDIKIPIPRTPKAEAEMIKAYERVKKDNAKLREEVDNLRQEQFKENLEKIRREARISELEEKVHQLTVAGISKSTH